ncbi:TIGR01777 family oxidoreductase [Ralstonia sp. SET104]|uniref:TIGR01777 family oxidoreductase n=1 Tax=Ralstonia sp. SET104 TaxID=2448774 RepID=UPI000F573DD8|nr:TIGR01777 family oxidoreductase [Ralstonia sp. SET104]GCB04436.1 NAD-dependent dehydratase [Ralstonia sp. SET104]
MRILLTGGTGLIGRVLCHRWKGEGHDVIVWSRTPHRVPTLCSGARGIATLQELDDSVALDAVVNLAGAPIADRPWTAHRRDVLWRSRVDLTCRLVDWLGERVQRPRVLLSASATGWYGDRGNERLDEGSRPGEGDFGSRLCVAWEEQAKRAEQLGIRVALLRTAPVLARNGGMLPKLRMPFSMGLGGRLGSGRQWMPWVHLDDVIGLIEFLLQHEDCEGVFNACAPHVVCNSEFAQALARELHRPMLFSVPAWALRMALREMAILLLGSQHVEPRRALEAGYQFRFSRLEDALANLLTGANAPVDAITPASTSEM